MSSLVFILTLLTEAHFRQSLLGFSKTQLAGQTGGDMKCRPQMFALALRFQDKLHKQCKDTFFVCLYVLKLSKVLSGKINGNFEIYYYFCSC